MIIKIILGIIIAFVVVYTIVKLYKYRTLYPLFSRKYNFGKRRNTFKKSLELMKKNNAKTLIETGTSRNGLKNTKSDGAATIVFGLWAKNNNAFLHSVDIDDQSVKECQKEVINQGLDGFVSIHKDDSINFLKKFDKKVDFLYLDSYDYSKKDLKIQLKSQKHHLEEFKAIENKLHEKSIVLIDDCRLPNGGKGKLVVNYMISKGWKKVLNNYQILLIKNER